MPHVISCTGDSHGDNAEYQGACFVHGSILFYVIRLPDKRLNMSMEKGIAELI
jgi:hypothetical protein